MATFTFNIAKGRGVELYNRVKSNDPSTSALIVVVLKGGETQANLEDADTLTAVIATAADEVTGTGWNRKTLTDTDLAAVPAPDDTNNRYAVQVPSFNWTPSTGADTSTGLVICYQADTGTGTDSTAVPLTHHDFAWVPASTQVTVVVGDFLRDI